MAPRRPGRGLHDVRPRRRDGVDLPGSGEHQPDQRALDGSVWAEGRRSPPAGLPGRQPAHRHLLRAWLDGGAAPGDRAGDPPPRARDRPPRLPARRAGGPVARGGGGDPDPHVEDPRRHHRPGADRIPGAAVRDHPRDRGPAPQARVPLREQPAGHALAVLSSGLAAARGDSGAVAARRRPLLRVRTASAAVPADLSASSGALGLEGRVPGHARGRRRLHADPSSAVHRRSVTRADAATAGGLHADVPRRVVHPRRRARPLRAQRGGGRGHRRSTAARGAAGVRPGRAPWSAAAREVAPDQALKRIHCWPEGHWGWLIPVTHKHGIRCGELAFVGGQVDKDIKGFVLHAYDLRTQTREVMRHIGTVLRGLDLDAGDLVKLVAFYVNRGEVDESAFLADVASYLPGPVGPAITAVPVPYLAYPGMLVEIEAIAMRREDGARLASTVAAPGGGSTRPAPFSPGLRRGRMLHVSGQTARGVGEVLPAGDLLAQGKLVMERVEHILTAAGASFADVVKVNAYYRSADASAWSRCLDAWAPSFREPGPVVP